MPEDTRIPLLEITHLSKSFGVQRALDNVSLSIEEGEVVALLGPSGCAKSTLLRSINGLEPHDAGTLRLRGERIGGPGYDWRAVRRRLGMVFQSYELFPHLSVLENLILAPTVVQGLPRPVALERARQWLQRVGLADRENARPNQLSGGQKQRIAIVRALCLEPELMLFDEVTAALDPEMVREVLDVVLDLADSGMSMVLVTHEMAFARAVADRIVFMDGGRIIESAPPSEFFNTPRTTRAARFLDRVLHFEPHRNNSGAGI